MVGTTDEGLGGDTGAFVLPLVARSGLSWTRKATLPGMVREPIYQPDPSTTSPPPSTAALRWARRVRDRYVARMYGKAYADRWYAELRDRHARRVP